MAATETKQTTQTAEPEITNYELFIVVLSVLSLVNLILLVLPLDPVIHTIILIIDFVYTAIFLGDFFTRLARATSKRAYFIDEAGWLDLLGSLPALRIFRIFRVVRVSRGVRRVGLGGLWRSFMRQRAASALLTTVLAGLIVLQYASIFVIDAERRSPNANIKSASDAIWWAYVTMTTVGYGDRYPVTNAGRLVGVVLMTLGVGLFGVLTGFLATAFVGPKEDTSPEKSPPAAPDAAATSTAHEPSHQNIVLSSAVPPADLSARLEWLSQRMGELDHELRQLSQYLREQHEHPPIHQL